MTDVISNWHHFLLIALPRAIKYTKEDGLQKVFLATLFYSILGFFCFIIKSILKSTTGTAKWSFVMQVVYPFGLPIQRL